MTGTGVLEWVTSPDAFRRRLEGWRAGGLRVGMVPTMGALHPGHLALIRRARRETDRVAVSLFVNPLQFEDAHDLRGYPRDRAGDQEALRAARVDCGFAPAPRRIFPPEFSTRVSVSAGTNRWEGAARPAHFDGVATVVARLLVLTGPCRAYFGEKDAQQLQLVRRLVADLGLPVEVRACPTVREPDGLPWSSRNRRLTSAQRAAAVCLPAAVAAVLAAYGRSERDAERLGRLAAGVVEAEPLASLDYAAVVDGASFEPVAVAGPSARLLLAVRVGPVRLIDGARLGDRALASRACRWGRSRSERVAAGGGGRPAR